MAQEKISFCCVIIAIVIIGVCTSLSSGQVQENPTAKADKDYYLAQEYIQMGQSDKAKDIIIETLKLNPELLKIHRLYQSLFPYKDIIGYYQKQYEMNKDKALWVYLYFRLLAREDVEKGCAGIRDAEKKFPNYVYLELASSTCDVANLNWSAGEIVLSNLIKRQDAPVEAFENMLRLYALEDKKNMLLPVCKEGLAKYPQEPSLYRLCVGYSEDIVPDDEKKAYVENANKIFEKSSQLAEILFTYGRSLKDEKAKYSYLEDLWIKYPTNRVSSNIFSMLWAQYSKADKPKLEELAKAALQKDRVGDAFMYTSAVNYLADSWKNNESKYKTLLAELKVTELNWQGILILAEKLIDNKILLKDIHPVLLELMNRIKSEKSISKDYLFRNYISLARCAHMSADNKNALNYYELARNWLESSFTEADWLDYSALLNAMKKKKELLDAAADCYAYFLNEECLQYKDKHVKKEEFMKKVLEMRKKLYPSALTFNWKTFEGKEILSTNLAPYSLFIVLFADSDNCTKLIEDNKEKIKKLPNNFSGYIIVLGDTLEQALEYNKKLNSSLPAAFASDASQILEIKGIPSIVVLNKSGFVVFKKYIDMEKIKSYNIENVWKMILAE